MSVANFNPNDVTAAILAGGEGRRVDGQDKGLLELAGKPLIAHVVAALSGQVSTILICANRHAAEYSQFGRVVADDMPGFHGPLAGIAAALSQCKTLWLLSIPVDGPSLPLNLALRLCAVATGASAGAAVAHDGSRRQPLFALYRANLAASATVALKRDLPAWRWQDGIGAVQVDFSDTPQAFSNLNTLDEFRAWERSHAG